MARPKTIKDDVRVSVVMSKQQLERIKQMCISMSRQEGRMISVSEAIRLAIEAVYQVSKDQQLDMFSS